VLSSSSLCSSWFAGAFAAGALMFRGQVMRCTCCGLRFHCRRTDLADSVKRRAEETDGKEQAGFISLAALFAPPGAEGYEAWRRGSEWHDPSLTT
jgi:hypothetical protein